MLYYFIIYYQVNIDEDFHQISSNKCKAKYSQNKNLAIIKMHTIILVRINGFARNRRFSRGCSFSYWLGRIRSTWAATKYQKFKRIENSFPLIGNSQQLLFEMEWYVIKLFCLLIFISRSPFSLNFKDPFKYKFDY